MPVFRIAWTVIISAILFTSCLNGEADAREAVLRAEVNDHQFVTKLGEEDILGRSKDTTDKIVPQVTLSAPVGVYSVCDKHCPSPGEGQTENATRLAIGSVRIGVLNDHAKPLHDPESIGGGQIRARFEVEQHRMGGGDFRRGPNDLRGPNNATDQIVFENGPTRLLETGDTRLEPTDRKADRLTGIRDKQVGADTSDDGRSCPIILDREADCDGEASVTCRVRVGARILGLNIQPTAGKFGDGRPQSGTGNFVLPHAGAKDGRSNESVNKNTKGCPFGPFEYLFLVFAAVTLGGCVLGFKGINGYSDLKLFGGWLISAIGLNALASLIIEGPGGLDSYLSGLASDYGSLIGGVLLIAVGILLMWWSFLNLDLSSRRRRVRYRIILACVVGFILIGQGTSLILSGKLLLPDLFTTCGGNSSPPPRGIYSKFYEQTLNPGRIILEHDGSWSSEGRAHEAIATIEVTDHRLTSNDQRALSAISITDLPGGGRAVDGTMATNAHVCSAPVSILAVWDQPRPGAENGQDENAAGPSVQIAQVGMLQDSPQERDVCAERSPQCIRPIDLRLTDPIGGGFDGSFVQVTANGRSENAHDGDERDDTNGDHGADATSYLPAILGLANARIISIRVRGTSLLPQIDSEMTAIDPGRIDRQEASSIYGFDAECDAGLVGCIIRQTVPDTTDDNMTQNVQLIDWQLLRVRPDALDLIGGYPRILNPAYFLTGENRRSKLVNSPDFALSSITSLFLARPDIIRTYRTIRHADFEIGDNVEGGQMADVMELECDWENKVARWIPRDSVRNGNVGVDPGTLVATHLLQLVDRGVGLYVGVATEPHSENGEPDSGKSGQSAVVTMKTASDYLDELPTRHNNIVKEVLGLFLMAFGYVLLLWGIGAIRILPPRWKILGGIGILAALACFFHGFQFLTN